MESDAPGADIVTRERLWQGDAVYQGNVRQVREAGEGMIKTVEEEGR